VTLISTPAGFGKTTLVTAWLGELKGDTQGKYTLAWLSLDEGDNDLTRFLTYLTAALNRIEALDSTAEHGILSQLQSPQPPIETVLPLLVNEVTTFPGKIIFVFDDYHLVEAQTVHDAMNFLIDNLPPQMHLVIVTREDPPLPLAKLRARDHLTELRATDLQFTYTEATEFLNQVMGLGLSGEDIAALEARTEGWIAGLQLAAISLRGQADRSQLIRAFTGSHRLVLDYLVEEVLAQQPPHIRDFLLRTAILDRMTGALCDAVTGLGNGQKTLETLDRANLFVVPLDHERLWYRYHQLFADLLRGWLSQDDPQRVPGLHLLASQWYEENGHWPEAIHHAFSAGDLQWVADLAELSWDPMNMSYQAVTWLGWVKNLPDEIVHSRPVLLAGCGWASLDAGDLVGAEGYLQHAEDALDTVADLKSRRSTVPEQPALPSEEVYRSLSASVANARAYLAQALGDVSGTLKYAQRASGLLSEEDYFDQGLADILPGFAYWSVGDLDQAGQAIATAISKMKVIGKTIFVISFTSYLVDILIAQGRLQEALSTYLGLLETVNEQRKPGVKEISVVHLGLSELYLEMGDMEAARHHLQRSEALGEQPWFSPWYRHWIYAHARVMESQGDLDGVIELLNGAAHLYYRHPIPDVRPLTALIARARLAQGDLAEVSRWVQEQGLSVDDELSYLREFEHITLARLLIARYRREGAAGDIQDALGLLARLLEAAEDGGRMRSTIEILALQAMALEAQGDIEAALETLERALQLAEPGGFCLTFVEEGPPMAGLLYKALLLGTRPDCIQRLLEAFPEVESESAETAEVQTSGGGLIEPLSEREIEVLQLIAEGLTNAQIASRLYLTLNTVKAHSRSIYSKLGVNNRTQAGLRARSLGIIRPT